jgi:hypothetical protein
MFHTIRGSRFVSILCVLALVQPIGLPDPKAQTSAPPSVLFVPFWKINDGFETTLVLRNRHIRASVTVTPVLYADEGRILRLPTFTLSPNSVQMVSLSGTLAGHENRPETGALAFEFQEPGRSTFFAQVVVKNISKGLIYTFSASPGERAGMPPVALSAPWWLRDDETQSTLALFNTSGATTLVHASVTVTETSHSFQDIPLGPHESRRLDFRKLLRENGIQDAEKGFLTVTSEGPGGTVLPALLFTNEKNGFSLTANFSPRTSSHQHEAALFHVPDLMINQPDPMMGFDPKLRFTPYALLSNTTDLPVSVQMKASFAGMGMGMPAMVTLPVSPLAPRETRVVNFSKFSASGLIPKDVNMMALELSHDGIQGDVAFQIFSVDQSGNFVLGVEAKTGAAFRNDLLYWSTLGNEDTMATVQNVTEAEISVRVTLGFADGKDAYKLSVLNIAPGAIAMVDLKEILMAAQPDEEGNIIPPGTNLGTARIELGKGSAGGFIMDAAVFDPIAGTCGTSCGPCPPIDSVTVDPNPAIAAVGTTIFAAATANNSDLSKTDVTCQLSWSSSDSSIVSAQSCGNLSFTAPGQVTIFAQGSLSTSSAGGEIDPAAGNCSGCVTQFFSASASATSKPALSFNTNTPPFTFFGSDPSIPHVQQQAIANPTGGTYSWTVTPANQVSFDTNNSTSADVVQLTGNNPSTSLGDTTLTVNYTVNNHSADPATRAITVRIFRFIVLRATTPAPLPAGTFGYDLRLTYDVYTNPSGQIVPPGFSGISVPESISVTSTNIPGATTHTGTGATDANTEFTDRLALISNQPIPSTVSEVDSQDIFVGGLFVRNNTLQYAATTVTVTNNGPTN